MGKQITVLLVFILFTASMITFLPAKAEDKTTIIVPDDYQTISEAVKNANAGDTILVKKGTYEEKQLTINKPLSLVGENAEYTTLNLDPPLRISPPDAIGRSFHRFELAMTVNASDFNLSGFTIRIPIKEELGWPGGGIYIVANRTQITGNRIIGTISMFVESSYCNITENIFPKHILEGDYFAVRGSHSTIVGNSGAIYAVGSYWNISYNKEAYIDLTGSSSVIYGNNAPKGITVSGEENLVAKNVIDRADVGLTINGSNNIVCANKISNCRSGSFSENALNIPTRGIALRISGENLLYANSVTDNSWGVSIIEYIKYDKNNLVSTFYNKNFIGNKYRGGR